MTELDRLAAALLAEWRSGGRTGGGPIGVGAILDNLLPYRVARRSLGIDASEDYEALVMRLLAEEQQLVDVTPPDAAEMARTTMAEKVPDLDVLQLLRSASVTFTNSAVHRLSGADYKSAPGDVAPAGAVATGARANTTGTSATNTGAAAVITPVVTQCWSCEQMLPSGRKVNFCPFCGADQRPPVCNACGASLEREWKHCPECGEKV